MSILDKFEKKVEGAVNSAFSKMGSKDLKPVDFSLALKKELDLKAISINQNRTIAPNHFRLILSTEDFDKVEEWGSVAFADELAMDLAEYAKTQDYAFVGSVSVVFEEDVESEKGDFRVISESVRGTVQPGEQEKNPVLEIGGRRYPLTKETTIIGRDSSADIVLDDSGVSRKHMEIRLTPAGAIATDLGSTNGMYVEEKRVPAASLVNGNRITIGRSTLVFYDEMA